MATQIKLRRDTAANWASEDPVLAQGEPGYDTTNGILKIGDGSTIWSLLPSIYDPKTNIVPDADNTYDLGSPTKQWRHVYTAGGSIYLDNIKLTNVNGKFVATKVINPGEENEAEDPEDSNATSQIGGGSISVGNGQGPSVENVTEILINGTVTEIEPGLVGLSVNGIDGLQANTDFTPEAEGDTRYELNINEDITLRIYQGVNVGPTDLGPGISLGQGIHDPHRAGVIAIGNDDVGYNSKAGGVYIGAKAGWNETEAPQGENAIAIGARAAYTFAEDNSITLNATGENLDPTGAGLFVKPVREDVENTAKAVYYNTTTGEMTYADPTGGTASDQNVWIATFESNDTNNDVPGSANSIEYDSDGNIIALFVHYNPQGGNNYTSVAKFTSTGTKLWQVRYQGAGSTDGWGVAVDSSNGVIYVTGKISGDYDRTTVTQLSLIDGTINWSSVYDFGYSSTNGVIDISSNGDAVIVGYAYNGTDDQVTVIKLLFEDGTILWARVLDGQSDEEAYGMAVGPSGEVVVIGYMDQLGESGDTEDRMLVVKYDTNGAIAWQKAVLFDTGYNCNGADADIDSAGNIYVVGQYQKDNGQGGTNTAMSLVKFDSSGTAQWSRRVVGNCDTWATSVAIGPDDYLYLAGIAGNGDTSDFSCVVAKYLENGQVAWQRLLDNTTSWTFAGGFYTNTGSGSNIAVKNGYVAIGGGVGDPGQQVHALIAQFNTEGTTFTVGDWDYTPASFSGLLNSSASDLTIDDAGKTDSDISGAISITALGADVDNSEFLIPTLYRPGEATGTISFSGNEIRGNGAAEENFSYGRISIIPHVDTNSISQSFRNYGQYIDIYPTLAQDAPHIHIAAGKGTDSTGDLILGDDTQFVDINHQGYIKIRTYNSDTTTSYDWVFGQNGSVTFPTLTVNLHNGGSQSGQVLQFGDASQQVIITGPTPGTDQNAQRLIIQGQRGNGAGEGGDVYLWAGDADSNGGDIKIYAGDADGVSSGYGGYVNIAGGNGYNEGGHVHIDGGYSSAYTGGDVRIRSGGGAISAGQVQIVANNKTWSFEPSGTTTLPGAVVKSTVSKTGTGNDTGPAATLQDSGGWTDLIDGNYGPFTLGPVSFTVIVTSGVPAYTVISTSGNSVVGDTIGTLNSADMGGSGSHNANISVVTVTQAYTAIDLTKSINKLTDGNYTLADGVEGQIMYLVPQNGITPNAVFVGVANFRIGSYTGTDGLLFPFRIFNSANASFVDSLAFCTIIFTDGAWQQSGGAWD